jgi:3-hydroxyacyl-[acyl-carrier-protein] dehydratase
VRNVRYASFVQPGMSLRCEVDVVEIGESSAKFKGAGWVGDEQMVSGRFEMRCINLADRSPHLASADAAIVEQLRRQFRLIGGPQALEAAGKRAAGEAPVAPTR